ncbi:unnamed protein product [Dimorphilus gyrociliatus]|uniref:Uncharacterized protein n=1 Tax=Dimorphilus gyrociliatus TaxID=2664684 RepID=A0A7I8WE07_9ANNE|nr:unnamed protein product [Dimorphilus gyrociliatus]
MEEREIGVAFGPGIKQEFHVGLCITLGYDDIHFNAEACNHENGEKFDKEVNRKYAKVMAAKAWDISCCSP